jgi:hypothetical protein
MGKSLAYLACAASFMMIAYIALSDDGMAKCQKEHSYNVCVTVLR